MWHNTFPAAIGPAALFFAGIAFYAPWNDLNAAMPSGALIAQPSPPAAPVIPARSVFVRAYGAIANDALDDTAAIQRAIDAIHSRGGGSVLFAPGTYLLSVTPGRHPQALKLKSNLRLAAATTQGATLKLRERQGNYHAIMGTEHFDERLDNFVLQSLTIDQNGANNPVLRPDNDAGNSPDFAGLMLRHVLRVYAGSRVRVTGCKFLNQINVNTLTFSDHFSTSDVEIGNSSFLGTGGNVVNGKPIDYDHSTIYTDGPRMRVVNNRFSSKSGAGKQSAGARTAIEIHDDDQTITGNIIDGYTVGVNVTGSAVSSKRQLYANNSIANANVGFMIWSYADRVPVSEKNRPMLEDISIRNNTIRINSNDWLAAGFRGAGADGPSGGIVLEPGSDAAIDRLAISDNVIKFVKATTVDFWHDHFSSGITLRQCRWNAALQQCRPPTVPIRRLEIVRNKIENSPGPGIFTNTPIVSSITSLIALNNIFNPARSDELRYDDAALLRSGIYLEGRSESLKLSGNTVGDSLKPRRLSYGVAAESTCTGGCSIVDTRLNAPGAVQVSAKAGWKIN
jgi:Pectate lyase superfamily protein